VIDGYPVCYCFRGLSGNPYNGCEASDKSIFAMISKLNHTVYFDTYKTRDFLSIERCYTTSDCATGLFCTQGQCTKDPCSPSPCGKGNLNITLSQIVHWHICFWKNYGFKHYYYTYASIVLQEARVRQSLGEQSVHARKDILEKFLIAKRNVSLT